MEEEELFKISITAYGGGETLRAKIYCLKDYQPVDFSLLDDETRHKIVAVLQQTADEMAKRYRRHL